MSDTQQTGYVSENHIWHIIWLISNIIFLFVLIGAIARQDIEIKQFTDGKRTSLTKSTDIYGWVGIGISALIFIFVIARIVTIVSGHATNSNIREAIARRQLVRQNVKPEEYAQSVSRGTLPPVQASTAGKGIFSGFRRKPAPGQSVTVTNPAFNTGPIN